MNTLSIYIGSLQGKDYKTGKKSFFVEEFERKYRDFLSIWRNTTL
jgi:hypothetical protein